MLIRAMITVPGAIRIRPLIPDHAAIPTGRATLLRRLESRSPHVTGLPSASGTVMRGEFVTRASAANKRPDGAQDRSAERASPAWPSSAPGRQLTEGSECSAQTAIRPAHDAVPRLKGLIICADDRSAEIIGLWPPSPAAILVPAWKGGTNRGFHTATSGRSARVRSPRY
jgi:hypothetical protein